MSSKEISINFLKKSNTMQSSFKKHKKGGYLGLIGIDRPISHVESMVIEDKEGTKMFKRQGETLYGICRNQNICCRRLR